ncbi:MAG: YggS family pyridoxal phosphate-dependent enzyme [Bacillota bacterium]|nr:YggS family pyridoxal phosphate-dependent enzyme [Bacillota bacterium]
MLQKRIDAITKDLPSSIKLIAVSKTHTADEINAAIDCGITDIGENKVQEILSKYDSVKKVNWHFIGHLQTNKVKQIIDKVYMIHSVDSLHLAEEISKRATHEVNILIQVNAAGEEQKFGVSPDQVLDLANSVKDLPNIKLRGLMHIAPAADNPEDVRVYFKKVKNIFDKLKPQFGEDFDTLSMGMSNDYKVAIEEGATCVRIGTAIFGERNYSKSQ